MKTAVENSKDKLFKFKILSIDAKLLNNKNSKKRVLDILNQLQQYNLSRYIVIENKKDKKLAKEFMSNSQFNAQLLSVDSFHDKNKKLVSIAKNKSDLTLDEKIDIGKQILHLGYRTSNFIDTFEPPEGVVCHKFYKVVWGTQCPFDCSYCFLQLTYRMFPYVQQYLNLEDMFDEMEKLNKKVNSPIILNSGELSDSLALDGITNIGAEVIEKAKELENIRPLFLSKGSKTDHLPEVTKNKAIMSASLNTPSNAEVFEKRTAHPHDRIKAMKRLADKGYEIRCRIDPIITYYDNWAKEYESLIKKLFDIVKPTVITLGQPRFYSMLLNLIKKRQPKAGNYFDSDSVPSVGKRERPDFEHRLSTYKKIVNMIREYGDSNIALCKEDPKIIKQLDVDQGTCNCI